MRADLRLRQFGAALTGGEGTGVAPDPGLILIQSALGRFEAGSFVTSGSAVTEVSNQGTGGAGFDFNVLVGSGVDNTIATVNGIDCVQFGGDKSYETTAGQDIGDPVSVVIVGKVAASSGGSGEAFIDARSVSTKRHLAWRASTNFYQDQGSGASGNVLAAADTNINVWSLLYKGDATTKGRINAGSWVQGLTGTHATWDFGSLGSAYTGTIQLGAGAQLCAMWVWDSELTDAEFDAVLATANTRFGL